MADGLRCIAPEQRLARGLARLAGNTRDLWTPREVPRRPAANVCALEFLRDFVSQSQPVVLTELSEAEWPCLDRWTEEHFLRSVGDETVSVNITPGGLGDFVDEAGHFVKPLEEQMRFRDFWARLHRGGAPGECVPYLSRQNDSLRAELPALARDVPAAVPLGVEAFGNEPEAVNLWIGDGRATSSCHKDHYENLYVVVQGEKVFTLLPPAAVPFLHEQRCPPAHFERRAPAEGTRERLVTVLDQEPADDVPWVPLDVARPDLRRYPDFARASAVQVRVRRGELLYLPAMWYHQVSQRGVTVAVNYWHDMQFGHAYVHHQFLRDVAGLNDPELITEEGELDEGTALGGLQAPL